MAAAFGKQLALYLPDMDGVAAVVFGAVLVNGLAGQAVFPDVIVNHDRARLLRSAVINDITLAHPGLVRRLNELHTGNRLSHVFKEIGMPALVPLCTMTNLPALALLTPVNYVQIRPEGPANPGTVTPLTEPEDRWRWVLLGLKRRDFAPLTACVPPRTTWESEYRDREAAERWWTRIAEDEEHRREEAVRAQRDEQLAGRERQAAAAQEDLRTAVSEHLGTKDVDIDVVYYPRHGELEVLCFVKGELEWVSKRYDVEDRLWLRSTAAKAKTEAAKAMLTWKRAWWDYQDSCRESCPLFGPLPCEPKERTNVGDWGREVATRQRKHALAGAERLNGTWILTS